MIDKELMGRAHGALAVLRDTDPGAGVLRDLVAAIERTWPTEDGESADPGPTFPDLVYVGTNQHVVFSNPLPGLEELSRLELRIVEALLIHARELVENALSAKSVTQEW